MKRTIFERCQKLHVEKIYLVVAFNSDTEIFFCFISSCLILPQLLADEQPNFPTGILNVLSSFDDEGSDLVVGLIIFVTQYTSVVGSPDKDRLHTSQKCKRKLTVEQGDVGSSRVLSMPLKTTLKTLEQQSGW